MGPGSEYEVSVEMVQEKTADLLKNVRPPAPNTQSCPEESPSHLSPESLSAAGNAFVPDRKSRVCQPL